MKQEPIEIWHNKACTTSKKVLDLLQQTFQHVLVRDYLQQPPDTAELKQLLKKLGMPATGLLRTKDKVYQELFADTVWTEASCVKAMAAHPSIIERPVVILGDKAWLARPYDTFAAELERTIA